MSVFDDVDVIWGQPGIPGTGLTAGEKTTINSRLTSLEGSINAIPDSIGDMTDVSLAGIANGDLVKWDGSKLVKYTPAAITVPFVIPVIADGDGSPPGTGQVGIIRPNFACTITGWHINNDASGSIQWDVWVLGVSIVGSTKMQTSGASSNSSTNMSGWTTAVSSGTALEIRINSASGGLTVSSLNLFLTRSLTWGI